MSIPPPPGQGPGRYYPSAPPPPGDGARPKPPKRPMGAAGVAFTIIGCGALLVLAMFIGFIAVIMSADGDSSGSSDSSSDAEASAAPTGPATERFGPETVSVDLDSGDRFYIDLDAGTPQWTGAEMSGHDLIMSFLITPALLSHDSTEMTIAPVAPGEQPGRDGCWELLAEDPTYQVELEQDVPFCLETTDGRIAFVEITEVTDAAVAVRATVWE
ncbi:hypothetical protein [Allonocardiopsis opalescens]|uniref:Uncharacterized protein n=1 Tax=Allonocardiopsis opalescens TaxID=1144618 RepID=A0A2T0Q2R5_9ACTN|nr:hypothetical protein [Allonocardiopsis opalescens]PRX98084.1 hypothetical protein CLV72_105437 [Allonocardiopsis opalescens]